MNQLFLFSLYFSRRLSISRPVFSWPRRLRGKPRFPIRCRVLTLSHQALLPLAILPPLYGPVHPTFTDFVAPGIMITITFAQVSPTCQNQGQNLGQNLGQNQGQNQGVNTFAVGAVIHTVLCRGVILLHPHMLGSVYICFVFPRLCTLMHPGHCLDRGCVRVRSQRGSSGQVSHHLFTILSQLSQLSQPFQPLSPSHDGTCPGFLYCFPPSIDKWFYPALTRLQNMGNGRPAL